MREAPSHPGEVFISNITYVATREGWLYFAVTMDLYSRRVAGWHLAESVRTDLVMEAAQKPVASTGDKHGQFFTPIGAATTRVSVCGLG